MNAMHLVAVGWSYVVLMMALTEESVTAGIMTFFFYGVLPLGIILYLGGASRRRRRIEQERQQKLQAHERDGLSKPDQ